MTTYIPEALRREVVERGQIRCEYCRLLEMDSYYSHEIDHIYAEKHGGITESANLCLACADCNRHKGSNLCSLDPQTGDIVALYNPRNDLWKDHFQMFNNGKIQPLTAKGRVTERVLRFNRLELIAERIRLIALGKYL
jgi:HNH endonuclease